MRNGKARYPAATMAPDTAPTDPGDGYELVKNLIFDQVHKFRRRFGGEFDELMGEANAAFMRGHNRFLSGETATGLPINVSYATEIRLCVWYELFDAMRTRVRRQKAAPMIALDSGFEIPARDDGFDANEWAGELGADARYAVGLILDPPADIEKTIQAKGGEPRNYRSTVRAYLVTEGWAAARINTAFEEIRKALG